MSESVIIEGVTIYKRKPNDIIMPEDDNNKREIIIRLLDKMLNKLYEATA